MTMTVNNRFSVLLAQKRVNERRNIPLLEVAEKTGVTRQTLFRWANNSITRYDAPVINALCKYFECQPGDLFYYVES